MSCAGWRWAAWLGLAALGGCATVPAGDPAGLATSPWASHSVVGADDAWTHYPLPGKTPSVYRYARQDGRDTLAVASSSSASMLRHKVRVEPQALGRLRFSWKVPQLIAEADLGVRDRSDSPVRVILAFDGDRSRFGQRDALLSELARSITGEPMPYATLMYVWCNSRPAGTVIANPRTDRIRKLVVESGPERLNEWLDYERDVRADFRLAFGEEPGALVGVAIMTDTDNTQSVARAWYGPVRLLEPSGAAR